MGRKILEIYEEYKIMPFLREHMFRVAAVASMVCDSFDMSVDKESILTACLLHDMGNIIKADLNIFPEASEPEGIEYWQNVQNEYIKKYGKNEHEATSQIMKEVGLPESIIVLAKQTYFSFFCKHRDNNDFNIKIISYADSRVDPHGIVSYEERMDEGKKRYKNRKSTFGAVREDERKKLVECGSDTEKQIFSHCKIRPEDINNQTAAALISSLRNFVIHSI